MDVCATWSKSCLAKCQLECLSHFLYSLLLLLHSMQSPVIVDSGTEERSLRSEQYGMAMLDNNNLIRYSMMATFKADGSLLYITSCCRVYA